MVWKALHNEDLGVIELVYSGTVTSDEIREATIAAIALSHEHNVNRALVNTDEITGTGTALDHYDVPKTFEEQQLTRSIAIALVMPDDPQLREMSRLYETVCVNRGWTTKLFDTRDQAIAWLEDAS